MHVQSGILSGYSGFQVACPSTTPTKRRMRLTLLDLQRFSLALVIHIEYLGKLRSVAAFFKANLAFKTIATFWANPLYEIALKLKKNIQNLGSDPSLPHHCWYSQTISLIECQSVHNISGLKVSSPRCLRRLMGSMDNQPENRCSQMYAIS